MIAIKLISQETYVPKEPVPYEGESLTQPEMTLGIMEIYNRSMRGMEINGFTPIYYGKKHKELVGFENLSKLEKIEFAKKFKKYASDEVQKLKNEADKNNLKVQNETQTNNENNIN
jgi:hypothetical protein